MSPPESRKLTRVAVTVPERENSPAPNDALLLRNSTSVIVSVPALPTAPPTGLPALPSKPTPLRLTVAPWLNSAPPPLAVIVSHGLQLAKFSSRPSVPPVNVMPLSCSGRPPVTLRIRSGRPCESRLKVPSILRRGAPGAVIVSEWSTSSALPCVSP